MYPLTVPVLAPAFLPPAAYYAVMAAYPVAVIDTSLRYDKRAKTVHRTVVADSHGQRHLTVPIARPATSRTDWANVRISAHGNWWLTMRATLATIYGSTPFFNYYRDEFDRLLTPESVGEPITNLVIDLDAVIRRLLGLPTALSVVADPRDTAIDMSRVDFYCPTVVTPAGTLTIPDELAPGHTILDPLFRLGGDELRIMLQSIPFTR